VSSIKIILLTIFGHNVFSDDGPFRPKHVVSKRFLRVYVYIYTYIYIYIYMKLLLTCYTLYSIYFIYYTQYIGPECYIILIIYYDNTYYIVVSTLFI